MLQAARPQTDAVSDALLNPEEAKEHFPILAKPVYGKPLAYLDSAASTQKPKAVIRAMSDFMETDYANVHRGVHWLSQQASEQYESARARVARFVGAQTREIVFTANATSAINLVASSFGEGLEPGDEILLSELEHHANIVPWQRLRDQRGVVIKVVPVTDSGEFDYGAFRRLLGPKTRLVALAYASNVMGTILPVEEIIAASNEAGAKVLLDASQAVMHLPVNVKSLGVDFLVFTGHKIYGPTGIGVLYGRYELLNALPPWQCGGGMIASVSFEKTHFADAPARFEAGTPPIVEAVGLHAALDWLEGWGLEAVSAHETRLIDCALDRLSQIKGLRLIGEASPRVSLLSFLLEGVHAHDLGTFLDREGLAVRVGHHCAEPLMRRFGIAATVRASFALHNSLDEVEKLARATEEARAFFA